MGMESVSMRAPGRCVECIKDEDCSVTECAEISATRICCKRQDAIKKECVQTKNDDEGHDLL